MILKPVDLSSAPVTSLGWGIPQLKNDGAGISRRAATEQCCNRELTASQIVDIFNSTPRLSFAVAQAYSRANVGYTYWAEEAEFPTVYGCILKLFKRVSFFRYTLGNKKLWGCNVQAVSDFGKELVVSAHIPLLDRLYISSNGTLPRKERRIFECIARPQDGQLADDSEYVKRLLGDEYFLSADLGAFTLEQIERDPFAMAAACSDRKTYLYTDCVNGDYFINNLVICRSEQSIAE